MDWWYWLVLWILFVWATFPRGPIEPEGVVLMDWIAEQHKDDP